MTISTSVHSNAFNFMSFMQGGVDPRTGQYTLSLSLPDVKTNDLQGPGLPLSLGFNPLNTTDSGYGRGWSLQLSQYTVSNQVLSLSTGESLKSTSQDPPAPDGRARMYFAEQKLDTFHCYAVTSPGGGKQYWVMHKSGLVEVLAEQTGGVALPIEVYAPSGHKVTLAYKSFATSESLLDTVKDNAGDTLLTVTRAGNEVRIDLAAGTADPVRFLMRLRPNTALVEQIVLSTADNASWWLDYELKNDYYLVKEARTPVGARETLRYEDGGHQFPEGGALPPQPLPRVTRHITDTGPGLASVEVGYTYMTDDPQPKHHNFLGYGVGITYTSDGLDNLYKYIGEYKYQSLETLYDGATAVREVRRTFNQFHLLTRETTTQGNHIQTVETEYGLRPGESFAAQPNDCQLPKKITTSWQVRGAGRLRAEEVSSTYDAVGNLLTQTQATGVVETSTWYPAAGETGKCPPDPEGFVRHLAKKAVTPGPSENPGAPRLETRYTYVALPPIINSPLTVWLAPATETLAQEGVSLPLQETAYTLINQPTDTLRHGRMDEQTVTMNGKVTKTAYAYAKVQSEAFGYVVLQTTETLTGFDHEDPADGNRHVQKVITLEHSLLNGEPLLNRDDNDVEIRYNYDVLRRVTRETVAPGTDYAASRSYSYMLCDNSVPSAPRPQAEQTMVDVKGVHTVTLFDGLNRAIEERRDDADAPAGSVNAEPRPIYTARYDLFGHLVEETEYDWFESVQKALTSTYQYDDWGQQRCVTGPDGVESHEQTNPVGTAEHDGPIQRSWQEGGTGKTGVTETWLNLFKKPVLTRRFDLGDTLISRHDYSYDGLGRTTQEVVGIGGLRRTTGFVYDAFDRLLENTLPDGAKVTRTFAAHSGEDLPTKISVALGTLNAVLGEQTFDGLGRMVRSITGGRVKTFNYAPGLSQPESVVTPSGHVIEYTYNPQLGEEPVTRKLRDASGLKGINIAPLEFEYDQENARLVSCKLDNVVVLARDYFSTGEVRSETQTVEGQVYTMEYSYSRLGRLLGYTDVLGQRQAYDYDAAGRLQQTVLGTTVSSFTYDELGRPATIRTHDGADHALAVTLTHDEFGRETERKFEFGTTTQTLTQHYNDVDCLTRRTLEEGANLLRDETYEYDDRGRLTNYTCEGSEKPVDAAGTALSSQAFTFDGLDNIKTLNTNGGENLAIYTYGTATQDPAQLQGIRNVPPNPAYPDKTFEYDDDGNLTKDEQDRTLTYDALGRLTAVLVDGANAANYQYDPLDKLSVHSSDASQDKLFYRDGVLANQVGSAQSSTFVRGGEHLLAEQRGGEMPAPMEKNLSGGVR